MLSGRTTCLGVLLWAAEFPNGQSRREPRADGSSSVVMYDVNPLHNKTFKKMFLVDLGNDVSERLRQSGDILSALAYLNAGLAKRGATQFVGPELLNEEFKRAKKRSGDG